ncbi:type II toxin-antitoxin system HipA family toxin, partial [Candidatus Poribacteria bacterium]|nr:type II toxin-antitoxin system HipA family toxin [Candidatus Poribacteria bacterium]
MDSRERQLSVIKRKIPDRVSVDAINVENQTQIAKFLKIEQKDVIRRLGIDGRIISAGYLGEFRNPEGGIHFTEWGTPNTGDYSIYRLNPLADASSIQEVEKYPWPDPDQYDFSGAAKLAESIGREYAVRGPYWQPIFCRACDLFGIEEAMVKMVIYPDVFEAVLEKAFAHTYQFCELLLSACGYNMPIFCLGDDFAT